MKTKIILSWSGGKDSALALYELKRNGDYKVAGLLTVVNEDYDRVSMHGFSSRLLEKQAQSLQLPLKTFYISKNASNQQYEKMMKETLEKYSAEGISSVAFGDIFLADVRKYREKNLSKLSMEAKFPLWKKDSAELARSFITYGFKAFVTCVDSNFLGCEFVARDVDEKFLSDLPPGVDPCGENGEFHTFVYDGPIFSEKISFNKGPVVLRENRFYYCDINPR